MSRNCDIFCTYTMAKPDEDEFSLADFTAIFRRLKFHAKDLDVVTCLPVVAQKGVYFPT